MYDLIQYTKKMRFNHNNKLLVLIFKYIFGITLIVLFIR